MNLYSGITNLTNRCVFHLGLLFGGKNVSTKEQAMSDISDTSAIVPYPQDIVSDVAEQEETGQEERERENENVIRNETQEYSEEHIGRNIDEIA
jgi:hypothetical protein